MSDQRTGLKTAAAALLSLTLFTVSATLFAVVLGAALDIVLQRGLARFIGGILGAPPAAALATAVIDRWPKHYSGAAVLAALAVAAVVIVPAAFLGLIPGVPSVDVLAPALVGLMAASLLLLAPKGPGRNRP
jgi:hypothetical protein